MNLENVNEKCYLMLNCNGQIWGTKTESMTFTNIPGETNYQQVVPVISFCSQAYINHTNIRIGKNGKGNGWLPVSVPVSSFWNSKADKGNKIPSTFYTLLLWSQTDW